MSNDQQKRKLALQEEQSREQAQMAAGGAGIFTHFAAQMSNQQGQISGLDDITKETVLEGFKKKVYAIVLAMLLVTFGWVWLVLGVQSVGKFVLTHAWLFYTSTGIVIALSIFIICYSDLSFPANYVALFIYALFESYVAGFICAGYCYRWDYSPTPDGSNLVLTTFGITCGLVLFLGIVANQKLVDLTELRLGLLGGALLLLMAPLMIAFSPWRGFVVWLCIIVVSFYIIYDIEMIQSGKFDTDHYATAALMVYTDIVQLFLYVLQALASSR